MTITTKIILIVVLLIGLALTYFAYRRSIKAHAANDTPVSDKGFLLSHLEASKSENGLFLSIQEQLGDVFHVQFGTSLNFVITSTTSNPVPDITVDILLVDPEKLTPKLAVFLQEGGMMWSSDNDSAFLDASEALQSVGVTVLSLTKQDHYQTDDIVKQILDSLEVESPYYQAP